MECRDIHQQQKSTTITASPGLAVVSIFGFLARVAGCRSIQQRGWICGEEHGIAWFSASASFFCEISR